MSKTITREKQIKLVQLLSCAILACVGEEGIPDGHVYAKLMPICGLDEYQTMRSNLVDTQAINLKSDYLTRGKNFDRIYSILKKQCDISEEVKNG